jgi:hypothetical protein
MARALAVPTVLALECLRRDAALQTRLAALQHQLLALDGPCSAARYASIERDTIALCMRLEAKPTARKWALSAPEAQ